MAPRRSTANGPTVSTERPGRPPPARANRQLGPLPRSRTTDLDRIVGDADTDATADSLAMERLLAAYASMNPDPSTDVDDAEGATVSADILMQAQETVQQLQKEVSHLLLVNEDLRMQLHDAYAAPRMPAGRSRSRIGACPAYPFSESLSRYPPRAGCRLEPATAWKPETDADASDPTGTAATAIKVADERIVALQERTRKVRDGDRGCGARAPRSAADSPRASQLVRRASTRGPAARRHAGGDDAGGVARARSRTTATSGRPSSPVGQPAFRASHARQCWRRNGPLGARA